MSNRVIKCLKGAVLGAVLTSLVVLLALGQRVNRNTNESVPIKADFPNDDPHLDGDFYDFAEKYSVKLIKKFSDKLGLAPLSTTAKSGVFEFRIWTNLGSLADPKLLIVRSTTAGNNAYFFDIDRHADPIKFRKEQVASPNSGWNKILYDVRSSLTTPTSLTRDPKFSLERDEGVILLELRDNDKYRRVLYGHNTRFPDGKRSIEICKYMASEFDANMDCE